MQEGYGGVMIWELGQDAKGKNSLLHAVQLGMNKQN
jgi:GH18 family chitinase